MLRDHWANLPIGSRGNHLALSSHVASDKLPPHDFCTLHHCLHLGEGDVTRKVFHAAVGRHDDAFGCHVGQRLPDAGRHRLGRLDRHVAEVDDAEDDGLAQAGELGAIELRLRGLDRDLLHPRLLELGQERVAGRLVGLHGLGIAEADVDRRGSADAVERRIEHLDAIGLGLLRPRLHPRLVDLHDVGAAGEQVLDLGIDGGGIVEGHRFLVAVKIVLRLLRHGEGTGHRYLDHAIRVGAQEFHVADLDRMPAPDLSHHARHRDFCATALDGIDLDNPGSTISRSGAKIPVPRVVGKIRRRYPVEVGDVKFLRANTDRMIKLTVPGPFTMAQQAEDSFYRDEEAMALDYAAAVNAEIKDLFAAGADVVQIDEPWMQARPEKAKAYGIKVLNAALDGVTGTTAVHICFGYAQTVKGDKPTGYAFLSEFEQARVQQVSVETAQPKLDCTQLAALSKTVILGVIDLGDMAVEAPETVAARIRRALPYAAPERIIVAPDCGMKYLPRDVAFAKMQAMVEGAKIVRRELG